MLGSCQQISINWEGGETGETASRNDSNKDGKGIGPRSTSEKNILSRKLSYPMHSGNRVSHGQN
jgi:hypothetical protein